MSSEILNKFEKTNKEFSKLDAIHVRKEAVGE